MEENKKDYYYSFKCLICDKQNKNIRSLYRHIVCNHNIIPKDLYYETNPELYINCYICNKQLNILKSDYSLRGFKTCSKGCLKKFQQRKQSQETIQKRINKTDYKKAMETRTLNNLKKYNVKNTSCLKEIADKISKSNKGKKSPRTKEHQQKIIDSKLKNGTLKHSDTTKKKISVQINNYWQNENGESLASTVSNNKGGRGYKKGFLNNLFFKSSYEEKFILFCMKNNIKIESAENKKFRVRYIGLDNKFHFYYPDFYLPDYNTIIELKPSGLLNDETNMIKFDEACKNLENYSILTEEELNNEENLLEFFKNIKLIQ